MPLSMRLSSLFPDDPNQLPLPGTPEQAELIAEEEGIATEGYLETIRSFDPQADQLYDEVARNAVAVLSAVMKRKDLRVLDVAAGTALEIQALIKHDISIRSLTLTDYSKKALDVAHKLLMKTPQASELPKIELLPFDLLTDSIVEKAGRDYDLVLSCNSFMHFGKADHQRIIKDVCEVLGNRGVFVFESHFRIMESDWKRAIIRGTQDRMASRGQDPAFIAEVGAHYERFHHYHPCYEVYNWLEQAGFGYFDCVYRNRMIGIFVAVK